MSDNSDLFPVEEPMFEYDDSENVILTEEEPSKEVEPESKIEVFILDAFYSARNLKEYRVRETGSNRTFKIKASKMKSYRQFVNEKFLKEI